MTAIDFFYSDVFLLCIFLIYAWKTLFVVMLIPSCHFKDPIAAFRWASYRGVVKGDPHPVPLHRTLCSISGSGQYELITF